VTALIESRAIWLLAIGQTLTYAGVYYAFPALLPDLQLQTGWSTAQLALGPTAGFLVMACLTPLTGRWVDRGFGGEMLIWGPVLSAVLVAALGFAQTPGMWFLLWAALGVAQACCLYETCFAFLTRRLGQGARPAITRVTLVAGFAGTLAFPLGDFLGKLLGGQGALVAFAVIIFVGAVPVNAFGVRALRRLDKRQTGPTLPEPGALKAATQRIEFWALSAVFGLIWLNHGILLTYVLLLFEDRGAGALMSTIAAACIGPAQVLSRLVLLKQGARIANAPATLWSLVSILLAGGILWAAGMAPILIFGFALLQGAGAGLLSILRPMLVADLLGHRGFGTISGAVAVTPILATAAAPSVGAALLHFGGGGAVYASCLVMAMIGLAIGIWLLLRRQPQEDVH
jgi:MFS family permease